MNPIIQLMLAISVVGSNSLALSPIASTVATSFASVSATDVMLASALFGLGTAAGALVLAPSADRLGLKTALRYSLLLLLTGFVLSATAPALWVLCLGQSIAGIASGVALPCTYGLAAEIAPEGKENETLGKVLLGWTLSMVVGVSVASYLAETVHWRAVYGLWVIATAIVLFGLSSSRTNPGEPNESDQTLNESQSPWTALTQPKVVAGLLPVAAFMMAFYGVYGFLGTHLTVNLGASTTTGGFAALVYGAGFGAVSPIDKWMDKFGPIHSGVWVFSLLVLIYLSIGISSSSIQTVLWLCFVWGALNHLALNLLVAKLSAINPQRRAAIMGLYSATTYVSMFLGTLLFKSVFDSLGFSTLGFLAALFILPVAAVSLQAMRHNKKEAPSE